MGSQGFYIGHIKNSEDTRIELLIRAYEPQIEEIVNLDVYTATPVLPLQSEFFWCSICNQKLEKCNHAVGDKYDNEICKAIPDGYQDLGIKMNECTPLKYRVTDLLVFPKLGNYSKTIWYGFPSQIERLHRIEGMKEQGNISEAAFIHFRNFFSENVSGISEFID